MADEVGVGGAKSCPCRLPAGQHYIGCPVGDPLVPGRHLDQPLTMADFPPSYLLRMVLAYPVIAGMTADELAMSSQPERLAAYRRVLDARNLRRTHELFLAEHRG